MTTHSSELPLTRAQTDDLREWARRTEVELEDEEFYDCPIHGVVTGPDCPRC